MQKQLNQLEIDQILDFLKRHKVPYFDVQLELVDHFASAIESNWETYPNHWSFEQKILSIYNEIGPKGFTNIIGGKVRSLLQKANKFALNLLKDSLRLPQIIVTLACIYFLHQGFLTMENPAHLFAKGLGIPMLTLIISSALFYAYYYWRYKQRILALEQGISLYMLVPNALMLPVYWIDKANFHFSSEMYLLFSVMIFVQIIYCTGLLVVVRKIFWSPKDDMHILLKRKKLLMKQLTKNQIQELFAFTQAHRIRYYDLQSEVVDHLASAIETKWVENPTLSFQKALDEVYEGFGIYGFGKLEQEKRDAIQRKIGWKLWAYLKDYFTPPKLLTTLLLVVLTQLGLSMLDNPFVVTKYVVGVAIIAMFGFVEYRKRNIKDLIEKYLEINVVYTMGAPGLVVSIMLVDFLMIGGDYSSTILWVLAVWLVIALITAVGTYDYLVKTEKEVQLRYERK